MRAIEFRGKRRDTGEWVKQIIGWILTILLLMAILGTAGYLFMKSLQPTPSTYRIKIGDTSVLVRVQEIEGCEYLVYSAGLTNRIIHKPNCRNPAHTIWRELINTKNRTAPGD
jgi:hypothetical protein